MIIPRDTKDRFYVIVYCKPHVRKFIYDNCGDPADLSFLPHIFNHFHMILQNTKMSDKINEDRQKKGDRRYDQFCRVSHEDPPYPETMNICINKKQFYRDGFYLNYRGVIAFNKYVDAVIKDKAVTYVKANVDFFGNISDAIRKFQDMMGFTDQDLSLECIRKHIQRSNVKSDQTVKSTFIELFNRNFEANIQKKHHVKPLNVKNC